MAEVNIDQDLAAVMEQLKISVDELKEIEQRRSQVAQQIQNLNGVAMYLRGKQPEEVEDQTEEEEIEITPTQEE
tara:strand:- start:300 stop:521 length:222 start_codon:yes stop_codon:yes gene_type:complete